MARLKNRQMQIPGGLFFYVPELKWQARQGTSFDQIVNEVIQLRKGNPAMAQKFGWATDYNTVAEEVDAMNAEACRRMGWNDYVNEGGGSVSPPPRPRSSQRLSQLAAGAEILVDWIKDGAEAVPLRLATQRAAVCAKCPKNERGDLLRFFTLPAATAIRKALDSRREMKLSTIHDHELHVCSACSCPLKLKVHLDIGHIKARMNRETLNGLDRRCWILSEWNT